MIADQLVANQAQRAASYLAGEPPPGRAAADELGFWRDTQLLLPLVEAVRRHGDLSTLLDAEARDVYRAELRAAAAADAGERRVLLEVLASLRHAGVRGLLLKGVALAYTVYAASWLRARSDVDLLVPPGSLPTVVSALTRIGFAPDTEVVHPLVTRQRHLVRSQGFAVALDIHETLVNPPILRSLPDFEMLFARAQPVPRLSPMALALSTDDALLHALVHRVAHHNSSVDLLWLYDMHLLAQRMSPAEWERLVHTCAEARVSRIAGNGLRVLADVLRSPVPVDVLTRLDSVQGEPSAALLGGELTELRLQWINFKSLRGVRDRASFLRAHLAPPSQHVGFGRASRWRIPFSYVRRVVFGVRKWLQPISRTR